MHLIFLSSPKNKIKSNIIVPEFIILLMTKSYYLSVSFSPIQSVVFAPFMHDSLQFRCCLLETDPNKLSDPINTNKDLYDQLWLPRESMNLLLYMEVCMDICSTYMYKCILYHVGQWGHATLPQASELVVHPREADEIPSGDVAFYCTSPRT